VGEKGLIRGGGVTILMIRIIGFPIEKDVGDLQGKTRGTVSARFADRRKVLRTKKGLVT